MNPTVTTNQKYIVKTHKKNPMLGISEWNSENKDKEHILEGTDYSKTVLEARR